MRVGIDIDGVTLDFHNHMRAKYREWFGGKLDPFKKWDDILKFTHFERYTDLWDWCQIAGVWDDIPWVPGAPGTIDRLLADGHQVAFVTSRSGYAATAARRWHRESHFYGGTQIFTDLGDTKHTVKCGLYVDDSPGVIDSVRLTGRNVIVFDRPWNKHCPGPRAYTWDDVYEEVSAE